VVNNLRAVPIGETFVSRDADDVLVAYGLGSCVAVCLYDPVARVGGMLHALLPTPLDNPMEAKSTLDPATYSAKFVDQGISLLTNSLAELGGKRTRLIAHVYGGAQAMTAPGSEEEGKLNIGERNVQAAKRILKAKGIWIKTQDTGGCTGRTVKFYIATGQVSVSTPGQEERFLDK
jgi:chemotaxis protein CheD